MSGLLEQFGIHWQLLIAQIVNFTILFLVLRAFVWKPVLQALDARRARIESSLARADELTTQNASLEREAQLQRAKLRQEADKLVAQSREHAEQEARTIVAAAEAEAQKITAQGALHLAKEREALYAGVRAHVIELTLAATRQLLHEELSPERAGRAVDDALAAVSHLPREHA